MATPDAKGAQRAALDGGDMVVGVVRARWNVDVVDRLADGAQRAIDATGAESVVVSAPGAFELPFAAACLAQSGKVDAVVVLGCVIRGETTHYELVSEGCADGVQRVQLDTGIPIGFGVVTVENLAQALARSGPSGEHNVGEDAALAAVEMAVLARTVCETG